LYFCSHLEHATSNILRKIGFIGLGSLRVTHSYIPHPAIGVTYFPMTLGLAAVLLGATLATIPADDLCAILDNDLVDGHLITWGCALGMFLWFPFG
jgi:hypothetical protein